MNEKLLEQAREIFQTVRLLQDRIARRHGEMSKTDQENPVCAEVTMPQWVALMTVRERGEVTIKELAEALGVSPPSASTMVDRLVDMNMLRREQSQRDRREVLVALTPEGYDGIQVSERYLLQAITEIIEKVGPGCARQWCEVYMRIREVILEERERASAAQAKKAEA